MRRVFVTSAWLGLAIFCFFPGTSSGEQEAATPSHASTYLEWPAAGPYASIEGKHLWQYVKELSDISRRYRDDGHPQYWGRIAGTSGDLESAQWLMDKYRKIGLTDIHSQTIAFPKPQWAPLSWEVTAAAGNQSKKLLSAQPPYGDVDTDGKELDFPVAYLGLGSEADFAGRDVRGKAILLVRGEIGYSIAPNDVLKRAEVQGAAAILGTDLRGGNYKAIAYRTSAKIPTFNLGTEDGLALRDMVSAAGPGEPPHIKIRLDAKWASDQKSYLVWGTLPGTTDETIYVVAHRDGWFDAAGDNAGGVATMLGLAEHFAKIPRNQRRRTMIFIGLDGHHNIPDGSYGTTWLAANRDQFFRKTALFINAEHPSEMLTHSGITGRTEETIPMWWYAGGPSRPQLNKIALDAFRSFGVPLWVEERKPSGDITPFMAYVPGVIVQSSDYMHMHTDGDTPEIVSWAGLASVTRAYAQIIDRVNQLPLSDLQRPPELSPDSSRLRAIRCTAWLKDSTQACESN